MAAAFCRHPNHLRLIACDELNVGPLTASGMYAAIHIHSARMSDIIVEGSRVALGYPSALVLGTFRAMPVGNLYGFAIPAQALPFWDHTYVTSSDGKVWPCFGRSQNGSQICSGAGNTDMADCISQPASGASVQFPAGLGGSFMHGRNGVCHQIANRVLNPCGQTVSRANGYIGSFFTWGQYGSHGLTRYSPLSLPWPELSNCTSKHAHP